MSNLENLVPSRDLCRKIPNGHFADSALVWWGMCVYPRIHPDGVRYGEPYRRPGSFPAPTLAEILVALARLDVHPSMDWLDNVNEEICGRMCINTCAVAFRANPTTAALKLWLELNKEGEQ